MNKKTSFYNRVTGMKSGKKPGFPVQQPDQRS